MITNQRPGSSTPRGLPYPIHRLNTPQMAVWMISVTARREFASNLVKRPEYAGGVGLLSPELYLFSLVDPRGTIRELPPPHRVFEMWQIANQPELQRCPCANFIELESEGPWSESGKEGHHPLCQFDPTGAVVFDIAAKTALRRVGVEARGGELVRVEKTGKKPQERPDEWDRIRKEVRGT